MWERYEAEGGDFIPVEKWGKDHWSVLAYAESCAVDHNGVLTNAKMRCNSRLHRLFVYVDGHGVMHDGGQYPTRLKEGVLENHDDWSCLEDIAAAGLITIEWRIPYRARAAVFGNGEARILLTPLGFQVSAALRAHKAAGGQFAGFNYNLAPRPTEAEGLCQA